MEKLAVEHTGVAMIVPRKGRHRYTELPGVHGEKARAIINQCKDLVEQERADGDHVDMDNVHETLGGLIDKANEELISAGSFRNNK